MQAHWSLILNVFLLIGVMVAIAYVVKTKRQTTQPAPARASHAEEPSASLNYDDIIAVRQVNPTVTLEKPPARGAPKSAEELPLLQTKSTAATQTTATPRSIMLFLLAKDGRKFAGFELLEALLASGFRFGEGHLFHRHQQPHGQGPVLFSLAAATPSGTFDLQHIEAFEVHGLCLFMQPSNSPAIDVERFEILLDTAKQLSQRLDAHLLDDKRQVLSDDMLSRYQQELALN